MKESRVAKLARLGCTPQGVKWQTRKAIAEAVPSLAEMNNGAVTQLDDQINFFSVAVTPVKKIEIVRTPSTLLQQV